MSNVMDINNEMDAFCFEELLAKLDAVLPEGAHKTISLASVRKARNYARFAITMNEVKK